MVQGSLGHVREAVVDFLHHAEGWNLKVLPNSMILCIPAKMIYKDRLETVLSPFSNLQTATKRPFVYLFADSLFYFSSMQEVPTLERKEH